MHDYRLHYYHNRHENMNKRHLHHIWIKVRLIKLRYLVILAVCSALLCVFSLRANNEHMVKLRSAVYAADKAGSNVQIPLQRLQAYVTRHMNTDLSSGQTSVYPPIQLEYTYERLAEAQASQAASTNSELYTACIEQYVESHGAGQIAQIPSSLYEFSFVSPTWSSDLAGWSLVATILLGLIVIAKIATSWWFKHQLA
jgi:preprotein translocase subunit SecF